MRGEMSKYSWCEAGCILSEEVGVEHRSCDCTTVEDLMDDIARENKKIRQLKEEITRLKAEIYDLQCEEDD